MISASCCPLRNQDQTKYFMKTFRFYITQRAGIQHGRRKSSHIFAICHTNKERAKKAGLLLEKHLHNLNALGKNVGLRTDSLRF